MKELIRVYSLEDPIIWDENKQLLLKAILKAINMPFSMGVKKEFAFQVNPVSGWVNFEWQNQLWTSFQKRVLKTPQEAKKVADTFLRSLIKESTGKEFSSKKIPPILPHSIHTKIVHKSTRLVSHQDRFLIDHWMVSYAVQLKKNSTDTEFIELEGSTITIRIGFNDNIIGFSSQWRPSFLQSEEEELVHHHEEEHSDDETHDHDETQSTSSDQEEHEEQTIIFELAGESEFQNRIVPYYKSAESHHSSYSPASSTAFVISLSENYTLSGEKEISIQINGGSGDFAYSVHAFKPDEVFEEGHFKIADGIYREGDSKIYLPKAIYNLIIWVADVQTGFIRKYEQSIYSFPITDGETPSESIV